jgi:transposase-like protein
MKELKCPRCGEDKKQHKVGFSRAGSQRYRCFKCKKEYIQEPKDRRIKEEIREAAIKMLLSGSSGRQVGKHFNMHHENVLRWTKDEAKKKD